MADAKARDYSTAPTIGSDNWDLEPISAGAEEVNPLYSKETMTLLLN